MATLPPFKLQDNAGEERRFPAGGHALLFFVKEDCPTCTLVAPLLEAAGKAFGESMPVWVVSQDEDGPAIFRDRFGLSLPVLDDSALKTSFEYQVESVPTAILADGSGRQLRQLVGFAKVDWQALVTEVAGLAGREPPAIDWEAYPAWRPGCGSRSVEPGIHERLVAAAEGSPLRARRIEIADQDDPSEFMFDKGLTDGLPVVPPTPERVLKMLDGTPRDAQEVVGIVAPNLAPVTVEKVAINAVMAGCKPEYLPVVLAAVQAATSEEFNLHGVLATTHFPTPVIIVNGPIRDRIGLNYRMNALGQGTRANATIGRALQLIVRNVGGGRPGEVDRAALGQPGKFTFCIAEFEERSNWPPLHVERGFAARESTVTLFAGGSPTGFVDQLARDAKSLATTYGLMLATVSHPKHYPYGQVVVIVPPEHVDTFAKDGWSKEQVREQIQLATMRPVRELIQDAECAEGIPRAAAEKLGLDTMLPKFRDPKDIMLVVAGGEAGKFGAYLQGWVSGPMGSTAVTRRIED